jgi:predicted ribosomally synthesized peptide with nif11-like leader
MSEEQLKAFLEAVKADAGLQEKLKAAADADVVVAIAKEAGFVIAVEAVTGKGQELSDGELEGVTGGANSQDCEFSKRCNSLAYQQFGGGQCVKGPDDWW